MIEMEYKIGKSGAWEIEATLGEILKKFVALTRPRRLNSEFEPSSGSSIADGVIQGMARGKSITKLSPPPRPQRNGTAGGQL